MAETRKGPRRGGFTLVEIMIVVATIAMLAVMAIPSYVRARSKAQESRCVNNLRQIDGAKNLWALEHGKSTGATVLDGDVNPYLRESMAEMEEPAGGNYQIDVIGVDPSCDIGGGHTL